MYIRIYEWNTTTEKEPDKEQHKKVEHDRNRWHVRHRQSARSVLEHEADKGISKIAVKSSKENWREPKLSRHEVR